MLRKIRPYSKYVLDAVKATKAHIDNNPFQYKTATALLQNVSAPNRSSVEKAFKEVFGSGIKEYQVRQRLEAAKQFLESGMTKKQIASKCYYSCQASFCRAFKNQYGVTPTSIVLI